jgi:alginate O-acetyltransferase complex protein AlgI
MAIGLGGIFGFHFLENFNYPYMSLSITDFWRRWHISLSSWFKDYIYIPLGGSRVSTPRWLINILIVWTITGLWHGAEWNFIIWGLY